MRTWKCGQNSECADGCDLIIHTNLGVMIHLKPAGIGPIPHIRFIDGQSQRPSASFRCSMEFCSGCQAVMKPNQAGAAAYVEAQIMIFSQPITLQ